MEGIGNGDLPESDCVVTDDEEGESVSDDSVGQASKPGH